jgi:hypothetical protein
MIVFGLMTNWMSDIGMAKMMNIAHFTHLSMSAS